MVQLQHSSLQEIDKAHALVHRTFRAGALRPLAARRHQLHQLARLAQDNAAALADALAADLDKPRALAFALEIGPVVERALGSAARLAEWARADVPDAPEGAGERAWALRVEKMPKGPVLVIAPWNYPLILSLQPLIAAIAAGCPAVIKPSELAPAYATLLAQLVPAYLDPAAYAVVLGAVPETTRLLELKWAHIFYTGNARVARIVAAAAARHLTPLSLELGGKSPVLVDTTADLARAARRILWAKAACAGQTCVAPDYVVLPRARQAALVRELGKALRAFFPPAEGGALRAASYSRQVNAAHYARLKALLARSRGRVVLGGGSDDAALRIEPTVLADVRADDALMEEELFGPLLPLVPVEDVDEAIAFINARDEPLALYAFTDDPALKQRLRDETLSGSLVFNDTMQQLAADAVPFSGVGASGYGYQVMKYGFDAFTHLRTTADIAPEAEPALALRYPPYSDEALRVLSAAAYTPIPDA